MASAGKPDYGSAPSGLGYPGVGTEKPTPEACQWAMFVHLSSLAGWIGVPFGNFLGPVIVWMIKKDEMPFVDDQGKECLNFQISMLVYALVSAITVCGLVLLPVILVARHTCCRHRTDDHRRN